MSTTRLALLAAFGLSSAGCAETSFITLEVSADLAIPTQADELAVTVAAASDGAPLLSVTADLEAGQTFPITMLFETGDATPPELRETVEARLAGTPVARLSVQHRWRVGADTHVAVGPLAPLP